MTTVIKSVAAGTINAAQADKLRDELASKHTLIGSKCINVSVDGGEVNDSLVLVFDLAPDDAALDAAIAAYPSTLEGVTGTFAVTAGTEYLLREEIVLEGESIVLDVHVHTMLGFADSFSAEYADWYAMGNRFTGGSVKASSSSAVSLGGVPGQRVTAISTGTTLRIVLSIQRSGTLTINKNDIKIESRGKAPSPP